MKFRSRVFDRGLYIQSNLWKIIAESICDFRRAGNCFILIGYGRRRRVRYSFKWNYIFNTFPSILQIVTIIIKTFVKYERLLRISNVDISFLYCLYLMWVSFCWMMLSDFINFAKNIFLWKWIFVKLKLSTVYI